MEFNLESLLEIAHAKNASDLHISANMPPVLRINGEIEPLESSILTSEMSKKLIYDLLTDDQLKSFQNLQELDFSLQVKNTLRVRCNIFHKLTGVAAAFRLISNKIRSFKELNLPRAIEHLTQTLSGLILVTGNTGSGKTTTLATIIDMINTSRKAHIITVEDPIEFIYKSSSSIISQRELHTHTLSFPNALRSALREDPDIILIGEMRDLETIKMAITAAETGHLVLATIHSKDSATTVDRIIDAFPGEQQSQIRTQLSDNLKAVISQRLLPHISKSTRLPALEIMLQNSAIRSMIREKKTHQILSTIQTNRQAGMQSMDQSIMQLYNEKLISKNTALHNLTDVKLLLDKPDHNKKKSVFTKYV
ncbi:hypothetical protein AB834_07055 [PVC group bacterium (ex Bugula neritina AB1)]|nr:hypothetical protein AB834_07055 [PVC group bacterium (ex Bugula neritina AB1)]